MQLFGILIGIVISIILSFGIIKYLGVLASGDNIKRFELFSAMIDPSVKLYMVVPLNFIVFSSILAYIIVMISCILPIRKINKVELIAAIRESKDSKLRADRLKTSNMIGKLFGVEGEIAYKNTRKDRSRYRTIVISIVSSIVLYLTISQAYNFHRLDVNYGDEKTYNKELVSRGEISIRGEDYKKVANAAIDYLKEKGVVNSYTNIREVKADSNENPIDLKVSVSKDKLSEDGKYLYENGIIVLEDLGEDYLVNCAVQVVSGDVYEDILERLGINELRKNECIVFNTITDTKRRKEVNITDFNTGDSIIVKERQGKWAESISITELPEGLQNKLNAEGIEIYDKEEVEEKEDNKTNLHSYELLVAGVYTENVLPIIPGEVFPFYIVINEETEDEWKNIGNISKADWTGNDLYIDTDDIEQLRKEAERLENVFKDYDVSFGFIESATTFNSIRAIYDIEEIVINVFIIMIVLLCSLNIFSTIASSIVLRKKEFAMLKSMGMNNLSLNKMLILECLFYAWDSIIYGVIVSLIILFIMYVKMCDLNRYSFYIPFGDIALCITLTLGVIFIAMFSSKRSINKQNIIETIKDDNI